MPNPFETLDNGNLINYIIEPFIHIVTFGVVGIYYKSGRNPTLGSILYTAFYFIHIGILLLFGVFEWNKIAVIIILILYITCHMLINKLKTII